MLERSEIKWGSAHSRIENVVFYPKFLISYRQLVKWYSFIQMVGSWMYAEAEGSEKSSFVMVQGNFWIHNSLKNNLWDIKQKPDA